MKVERREVIAAIHKQRGEFMTADVAATLGVHSRRVSGHMESLGDAGQLKRVRMESGRYIWRHGSNWYVPCEQVADEVLTACAQLAAPFTSADVTEATGLNPLSAATALDSLRRRGKLVAAPREGLRRRYTLPEPDGAEWLPTNAAAERLGIHRRTLQRRARSGEFWTRTGANGAVEYLIEAEAETEAPNIARALELARELIAALEAAR